MARIMIQEPNPQTLDELIPIYGQQNTECNALKKVVKELNDKVKAAIHEAKKENQDIIVNGWKCKLSVEDTSTMNEDRLIDFAKKHKLDIICTKEYIDFDALEKLIYAGKIKEDVLLEMDSCKDLGTKDTLRILKLKEAENGK